ncbi:outer membrane porin, OprD family, partial [Salmonella enterica subsp. enterica]|nr:outer membrane porin, OprD family [Salmonella enterica subsp. enterica serovar Javiana]
MNKSSLALAVALGVIAQQASAAGFIEDSKATLGLRNFYYDLNTKNTANNNGEASEWGQGFIFNYTSGFTEGTVGFGLDAVGL